MKNTVPLNCETFYHVYNRGINSENLFKWEENYNYFLSRYANYIPKVVDTYAYSLLKNHFHLLIRTKPEEEILFNTKANRVQNSASDEKTASQIISLQFSHLFNGYTQAINKQHDRTGKLFELPFRRIEVSDDAYFSRLVYYIHANPQRHGLIDDFREYPYSSYQSHLSQRPTQLKRKEVVSWFGNLDEYLKFHSSFKDMRGINPVCFDDL